MTDYEEEWGADQLPPELLNERNKELLRIIRQLTAELNKKERDVEAANDRIANMQTHYGNVQNELKAMQEKLEEKRRAIEAEEHMKKLAEREIGRLQAEMKKLEKDSADIQDKVDSVQNSIFRVNEKIDQFKLQMNFNQEELEQWALAQKQKEEDFLALEKYQRADEAKIKDLTLQIEKLTKQVQQKKAELETEITETQAAQIELNKTAQDYRTLHRERQELVQQWEEAIENMKKRDEMIREAGERFAEGRALVRERQEQLAREAEFLAQEQQNNREAEAKVAVADRNVIKLRNEYTVAQQALKELEDELEVIKNTLSKASTDLNNRRLEHQSKLDELAAKRAKQEKMQRDVDRIKADLERETKTAAGLEKRAQQVEEMLREKEAQASALDKQLRDLKEEQYKRSQQLFKVKKQESDLIAEISGATSQSKNLQSKLQQLDSEAFKQQELLYTIEFQIQSMERKVSRAEGARTEEEQKALKAKIDELQKSYDEHAKQHQMLTTQLKRVQEEVRGNQRILEAKESERNRINDKILELTLENESRSLELKQKIKQKEDLMVQHDVLKLQVKRLRDLLKNRADEVYGLENRKFQLEMTMHEREQEIAMHKEVLAAELKIAEEERRRAQADLNERQQTVLKLKNKFEILLKRLQPDTGDGEDGAEISQATYLVRAAQQREELQRRGDELDQEIQQMIERDKQLDKTLALLKRSNLGFRDTLKRVDPSNDDVYQQKIQLEQKKREVESVINRRMTDLKEFQEAAMQKLEEMEQAKREKQEVELQIRRIQEAKAVLAKELEDLKRRRDMYKSKAAKLKREIYKKLGIPLSPTTSSTSSSNDNHNGEDQHQHQHHNNNNNNQNNNNNNDMPDEEKDIRILDIKEKNKQALLNLAAVVEPNPEMSTTLDRLLAEYGLDLPSRPVSARSSQVFSMTSSSVGGRSRSSSVSSNGSVRSSVSASSARSDISASFDDSSNFKPARAGSAGGGIAAAPKVVNISSQILERGMGSIANNMNGGGSGGSNSVRSSASSVRSSGSAGSARSNASVRSSTNSRSNSESKFSLPAIKNVKPKAVELKL